VKAWLLERAKMNPPAGVDTLFISERRKPLSRITVWHMIGLVAKAGGLGHLSIHPHMLRHSTGFNLVNKGTDIRIIQGYLGHKAISSTVRYTKLDSRRSLPRKYFQTNGIGRTRRSLGFDAYAGGRR
jgi:type 1 fimbriae regulatory protein FimB